jgi:RNA polymerase sigma-70 factor (ECF subfamily)
VSRALEPMIDAVDPAARELVARELPRLTDELAAARARWPDARNVTDDVLVAAIADGLAAQRDIPAALARLRLGDLLLARWAATGEPRAIAELERVHAGDLDAVLARFRRLHAGDDELRQLLRIKLFVATAGRRARIEDYGGFGFLQNWLRVTALRALVDVARGEQARKLEELLADDDLLGVPAEAQDVASAEVARAIKAAFARAVAALAPRQRNFLRHAHVDQLTLDQIAALYGVHRATVARTLAQGREELVRRTRRELAGALDLRDDQLDSIVRAADSRIDLSLSRVLRDSEGP